MSERWQLDSTSYSVAVCGLGLQSLFVIRSFVDQVRKWCVTHSCCWKSPRGGGGSGGGEEAREKAVGAGLER